MVFTPTRTYVVAGDGPNDQGPVRSSSRRSCRGSRAALTHARSPSTQIGVLFYSERMIKLLTSSIAIEDNGRPVQDTVEALPICLGATVDEQLQRVYWLVTDGNANNNQVLVFDYRFGAWVPLDVQRRVPADGAHPPRRAAHRGRRRRCVGQRRTDGPRRRVGDVARANAPALGLGRSRDSLAAGTLWSPAKKLEDCNVVVSVERDYPGQRRTTPCLTWASDDARDA